jgi:hypothetical protein
MGSAAWSARTTASAPAAGAAWRLDKLLLEQPNDSIIALCMALEALENQPEPVEVIEWL